MKILNIMQGTNLGGTEQASLRLMLGLTSRGHSCRVVSLNPIGTMGPLLTAHGIPAVGLPYLGRCGWRSFPAIRKALMIESADALLMTGHSLVGMLALGNLCPRRRVLAVHYHHTGTKPNWAWRIIYYIATQRFNAITFPSDFIRREAEAIYPRIKSRAFTVRNPLVVPDGVTEGERGQARRALGLSANVPVIGNAGWLIARKRFDVFLRVAHHVLGKLPSALFVIAGDGVERPRLEALARELGISERVVWLGWRRDMREFYLSLDLMLFNSDWDAMGLSPLEALSYGVPLVASVRQGGLAEVINSDIYGYLVNEHVVLELGSKVIELLEKRSLAQRQAQAGKERVRQMSDPNTIAATVEALFGGG